MDVSLTINGRDFSPRLSEYNVKQEVSHPDMITTMDGTEHYGKPRRRDVLVFTLWPFSDDEAQADFQALSGASLEVTYTNPRQGSGQKTRRMQLASDLEAAFGLRAVNGKRYYTGDEIVLRCVQAD